MQYTSYLIEVLVRNQNSFLLVKSGLEVLSEELSRHKAVLPNRDDATVVDSIAQFGKGHVQLIHSEKGKLVFNHLNSCRKLNTLQ